MINHFKTQGSKVIITGNAWYAPEKDFIQEKVAIDNGYIFIPFDDFRNHSENYALGQFENDGVSAHPSDTGMLNIATLLFNSILQTTL